MILKGNYNFPGLIKSGQKVECSYCVRTSADRYRRFVVSRADLLIAPHCHAEDACALTVIRQIDSNLSYF